MAFGERPNDPGILMQALFEGPDTALSGRFCQGERVFGYHWVDDNHLALYLIDVTGHGLDAALLSVSVANVIRTGALPGVGRNKAFLIQLICNKTCGDFIGPNASAATQLLGPLPTGRRQARAPGSGPT